MPDFCRGHPSAAVPDAADASDIQALAGLLQNRPENLERHLENLERHLENVERHLENLEPPSKPATNVRTSCKCKSILHL